eukprot:8436073-Alexandrium_andersonii.AAC.1
MSSAVLLPALRGRAVRPAPTAIHEGQRASGRNKGRCKGGERRAALVCAWRLLASSAWAELALASAGAGVGAGAGARVHACVRACA